MTSPRDLEAIRQRAALVAGNPDVEKIQSVRDRAVLLEYVTELEVIIARVQEYAYERNFYNQPMYISELLGIVGEPPELDVTDIRTVAHQTVIRAIESAQVIAAALNTTFTAKNGPDSTDDIINRANQVTAEIAVEALVAAGYQIIKPEGTPT